MFSFSVKFMVDGIQKASAFALVEQSSKAEQFKAYIEGLSPIRFKSKPVLDVIVHQATFECGDEEDAQCNMRYFTDACNYVVGHQTFDDLFNK